jgi:uncharacterized protein DUF6221
MELTEFIAARLDEDEAWWKWYIGQAEWEGPQLLAQQTDTDWPQRMLREVAAKRTIMALHYSVVSKCEQARYDSYTGAPIPDEYDGHCEICGWFDPSQGGCLTVRHVGAIWRDHPDYDPAWA